MNNLIECFEKFQFLKNTKIAIGVSGGIDSLALLLLFNDWAKQNNSILYTITVDHKLRETSTQEAITINNLCKNYNINHIILTWEGEKPLANIEAIAREKRYELIAKFCKENEIKYLLTGHHLEDQAETFFIRLFRGSGIDGLSCMQNEIIINNLHIVRPFLNIHKYELKNYLEKNNIQWIEDESNNDEKFVRNKIRNFLNSFENKEEITERIAFAVNEINKCKNFIQAKLEEVENKILDFSSFGICLINTSELLKLEDDLSLRLLAKTSMKISGNIYKPRLEKLKRLYEEIHNYYYNFENLKATFYGCIFQKYDENRMVVYREYNAIEDDFPLEYNKEVIWDNRFIIKLKKPIENLIITHIKSGEFNQVLESMRIFDFQKYKELKLIKGIEKDIFYTLPIVKQGKKYLFDYFYVDITAF